MQAGAKHVYAVEGSGMAEHCKELIRHNKYEDKITVIHGMIEEIEVPELVDTIVSGGHICDNSNTSQNGESFASHFIYFC